MFRHTISIVNSVSGARDARRIFASTVKSYFDSSGLVTEELVVPHIKNIAGRISIERQPNGMPVDAIVVCGGDGTVSSVVNVAATSSIAAVQQRPVVVVPAGCFNSIACSLGIQTPSASVAALSSGRFADLPVWQVVIGGATVRYIVSHVATGTYARAALRMRYMRDHVDNNVVLAPRLLFGFNASLAWTLCRDGSGDSVPGVRLLTGCGATNEKRWQCLVASQLRYQQGDGFSLTPNASWRAPHHLTVAGADATASRLRMLHWLTTESVRERPLDEDGVSTDIGGAVDDGVRFVSIDSQAILLDGEPVWLSDGEEVHITRTDKCIRFAVP